MCQDKVVGLNHGGLRFLTGRAHAYAVAPSFRSPRCLEQSEIGLSSIQTCVQVHIMERPVFLSRRTRQGFFFTFVHFYRTEAHSPLCYAAWPCLVFLPVRLASLASPLVVFCALNVFVAETNITCRLATKSRSCPLPSGTKSGALRGWG